MVDFDDVTRVQSSAETGRVSDASATVSPVAGRRSTIVLGLILLLGLALRLPTFARPLLSDDEAIYATTADAMRRGDVLYRDVVDHKPPAIYDVYLASSLALGSYNTQGAHALVVGAVLLCAAALFRASRRIGGNAVGLTAALLWVVFSTTMLEYDSLAANCELFLVSAQAVAVAWLLREPPGGRRTWLTWLGAGVLTGLSAVFKYQGATFVAVIGAAISLEVLRGRRRLRGAIAAAVMAGLGCLVVPGAYVVRAWHAGGLDAARYWFAFNFSYVAAGPSGWEAVRRGVLRIGLIGGIGALLPYAFGLRGAWETVRGWLDDRATPGAPSSAWAADSRTLATIWLASSAVALAAGGRFFGHYFHHVLPALSMLAASPLVRTWRGRPGWRPAISALGVAPALAALLCATALRAEVIARTDPEPAYEPLVRELQHVSRPDDRVFVWGNSPQVYVLAERPMGARFSFCNYMTGISPGTRTETGASDPTPYVLAASWTMLIDDLERRRPRFIVDAAAGGWDGYGAFQIARYPTLDRYVQGHYQPRRRVDGVVIYERSLP